MRFFAPGLVLLAVVVGACAPVPAPKPVEKPEPERPAQVQLRPWTFSGLAGWSDDRHGEALTAFQKSCAKWARLPQDRNVADHPGAPGGRVGDWMATCAQAQGLDSRDHARARRFFESAFVPYEVRDGEAQATPGEGLFTGYFEPELEGARTRGGDFQTPLLARPDDLVSVNLGQFDDELGGNTIWGRVIDGRLRPYTDRADIENGALGVSARPLLWVNNAVDAFFLHVQGSGRVRLEDGTVLRVGFAGKNGRPYRSIGRILIDRGEIPADRLTMASIRDWVAARPEKGADLLKQNPSYVFFRLLEGEDGPLGAQGVALTAERSLAVDRRYLPLGAPLWMETHDPLDRAKPLNRLMVAQDTGGAIKGVVRGDIFFGAGDLATRRAGNMKRPGRYFILLPHGVTP